MKKIVILGPAGVGKRTFAESLSVGNRNISG